MPNVTRVGKTGANPANHQCFPARLLVLQISNKCRTVAARLEQWRVLFSLPESKHQGWATGEFVIFSRAKIGRASCRALEFRRVIFRSSNKCRTVAARLEQWRVLFSLPESKHQGWATGEFVIFSRA